MTDQYIKMCREAAEIQGARGNNQKVGDLYYDSSENRGIMMYMGDATEIAFVTWLPRVENLIEMITKDGDTGINLVARLSAWTFDAKTQRPSCPSYRVLWLCFVMHTLYKKSWDGIHWK